MQVTAKAGDNAHRAADLDGSAVKLGQTGSRADRGDLHGYLGEPAPPGWRLTGCRPGLVSMAESSKIPKPMIPGCGLDSANSRPHPDRS